VRNLLILAVFIAALAAIDAFVFNGYYRRAVWQQAYYQGNQFSAEVRYQLNKIGFR